MQEIREIIKQKYNSSHGDATTQILLDRIRWGLRRGEIHLDHSQADFFKEMILIGSIRCNTKHTSFVANEIVTWINSLAGQPDE